MVTYKNLSGQSNVIAYEFGSDYIRVQFKSGRWTIYTYTDGSAGASVIQAMQGLAELGHGLNSYISRNKPGYSSKQ